MGSFISEYRKQNGTKKIKCAHCGRRIATEVHHPLPRCYGGQNTPDNQEPLCFHCHKQAHASKGDWQRWGRTGGKRTAWNAANWMRNLHQFKGWSDERWNLYLSAKMAGRSEAF